MLIATLCILGALCGAPPPEEKVLPTEKNIADKLAIEEKPTLPRRGWWREPRALATVAAVNFDLTSTLRWKRERNPLAAPFYGNRVGWYAAGNAYAWGSAYALHKLQRRRPKLAAFLRWAQIGAHVSFGVSNLVRRK